MGRRPCCSRTATGPARDARRNHAAPVARGGDPIRLSTINEAPLRAGGEYVLYWMVSARRASWNFALDRATWWACELGRPLLVFEALRADYPFASDRLHQFILDGMRDNALGLARARVGYYPYVEPAPRADRGLLDALASRAAVIVTDFFPGSFLQPAIARAAARLDVRVEQVDGNGLLPIAAAAPAQVFPTAYAFRRFLQKTLAPHLRERPRAVPRDVPAWDPSLFAADILDRWPPASLDGDSDARLLASLPIDHRVVPTAVHGGTAAARRRLRAFVERDLAQYVDKRAHPDDDVTSRLSPYLHFGHVSAHEIAATVLRAEKWTPARLSTSATGAKEGWWNAGAGAEAFLDELVTWRELGFNMSARRADAAAFGSLPPWALATLRRHESDPRPHRYTRAQLEQAATHDDLWNASQRQLAAEGRIHNYLRMLWGKKILEWSSTPEEALDTMVALNDRYALDGRDPNSTSGIFWVLGRYDRPWAPERPIFGRIRYMSSENTRKKLRVREYLRRWTPPGRPR